MISSYLFGSSKLSKDTIESAFLSLMVQGEEGIEEDEEQDADVNFKEALQGLADVISSCWTPSTNYHPDIHDVVYGTIGEELFLKAWIKAYLSTLKRLGFDAKVDPKDEKAVSDFIERGNSPDWDNPMAAGEIKAPRWLYVKAGTIAGEVEAERAADFYRYAREKEAEKGK